MMECPSDASAEICQCQGQQQNSSKLNKAYLRKLDRKFDRLFKGKFSTGRLTNTSKSVYSFEGEVLSEDDDEYNSDSSFEAERGDAKSKTIHEEVQGTQTRFESGEMPHDDIDYNLRDNIMLCPRLGLLHDELSQISGYSL